MIEPKVSVSLVSLENISPLCAKCMGKYIRNGKPDPEEAAKEFGIQPNSCYPDHDGRIHCPSLLGQI